MRTVQRVVLVSLVMGSLVLPIQAQKARWGSPNEETVKKIIEMEAMWASSDCAPQPNLKDVIADDFQGTAPDGHRYGKASAIATDDAARSRDCQLGVVTVQFFGDALAVAYGNESSTARDKEGISSRHCLAWTDTWLKRDGKWQIIAAQDTVVSCK
jgi:uncharacterized protein (TIGR02246 family)